MTAMDVENHISFSEHALARLVEMKLSKREARAVIRKPDFTYPGDYEHRGRTISVSGRLAVVHEGNTVVTVLWHSLTGREKPQEPVVGYELHTRGGGSDFACAECLPVALAEHRANDALMGHAQVDCGGESCGWCGQPL